MAREPKPLPDLPGETPSATPPRKRPYGRKPLEPGIYLPLVLLAPLIAMFVYAFNWRRMGRPAWIGITILGYVLVIMCMFLLGLLAIQIRVFDSNTIIGIFFGIFALQYVYVFSIYLVQANAHQFWKAHGTLTGFTPNVGQTVLISGGVVVVGAAVLFVVTQIDRNRTTTVTFNGGEISYGYPFDARSINTLSVCDPDAENECLAVLDTTQVGGPLTTFFLIAWRGLRRGGCSCV